MGLVESTAATLSRLKRKQVKRDSMCRLFFRFVICNLDHLMSSAKYMSFSYAMVVTRFLPAMDLSDGVGMSSG
jgi:hypothetical protein